MSFVEELQIFGGERDTAQKYFFGFLATQMVPFHNREVLEHMNETSTFWITTRHALLMSTFLALGRIFDENSKHNVNRLLTAVSSEIHLFTRSELERRKIADGLDPEVAAGYVADRHELTHPEIRAMRAAVKVWRKVYEDRYRDVRHKVFAHREVSYAVADQLLAKTTIPEMKELLGFLSALHRSLLQLHLNGLKPDLTVRPFALPPVSDPDSNNLEPGERMYRESAHLMYGLVGPDR